MMLSTYKQFWRNEKKICQLSFSVCIYNHDYNGQRVQKQELKHTLLSKLETDNVFIKA